MPTADQSTTDDQLDLIQVWSWLDRRAAAWPVLALAESVANARLGMPEAPRASDQAFPPSALSAVVLEGRRMFFSSDDPRMAAAGSGLICAGLSIGRP